MAKSNRSTVQDIDEDVALRNIMEGTATETGERFFAALVENLAKSLNTRGAWVTEYLEEFRKLRSIAFWFGGEWIGDYEYDISGTPCGTVIENRRLVHIPEKVIELYPRDPDLKPMNAVSYMGVPLTDIDGSILGHLAVLDSRPMPKNKRAQAIIQIFAARAGAELQRIRAETEVREREEKLSRILDSAMDAIIELDHNFNILYINAAAEKIFGWESNGHTGQSFKNFLSTESRGKLTYLARTLDSHPENQKYLWIPGGIKVVNREFEDFLAEATLSRFEMKGGAFYTIILRNVNERIEAEQKIFSLSQESDYLREEINAIQGFEDIIGQSESLIKVLRDVEQVADTDSTVLILGETGTGKELIARAIHKASRRHDKHLIKVNCAAIPSTLIESELFGHEQGAFTGATKKREGRFSIADGSTIFLDEIGELPLDLQVKLLRVLQEGEFEPVGSSHTRKVDVRVLAATNRDLYREVQEGNFREDLFFRLNVFPIVVPPLRERKDDIGTLASAFAKKFAQRMGREVEPPSQEIVLRLQAYDWPGNVRELENVIERAVITSRSGRLNVDRALPEVPQSIDETSTFSTEEIIKTVINSRELQELERQNIVLALDRSDWRVSGENGAAKLLGIPPTTLNSRMKALGIKKPK
jgi:PAS domain S-box-containing protein